MSSTAGIAYLVLCEGRDWRDIYTLHPGKPVSIGRGDSNRISLADNRCSRRHCEVCPQGEQWVVRDLESSNGTNLNGARLAHPTRLSEGDMIHVGKSFLLFTLTLDRPMESVDFEPTSDQHDATLASDAEETPAEILERRSQSVYRQDPVEAEKLRIPLAGLYRLVVEMGAAEDVSSLADVTLRGLFEVVRPDIGAVLVPSDTTKEPTTRNLKLVAFKAPEELPYSRVSDRLSDAALRERNGILAMDFSHSNDSEEFTTLASMNARSVICVPIRDGDDILGLIHLYSMKAEQSLDRDALEFTLAVGEHAGSMLRKLLSKTELVSSLKQARRENESLKEMLRIESDLIGESAAMLQLRSEISRFAMSDQTTLICGESGVGKELVARAIHSNSSRKDAPFVAVNCAALTESLLESELFGHEKGAFTGATDRKIGKFEQAHKGTIFLDEIGEMSPTMQAKFLRVLEGQPFERVGGHTPVDVNVRVVAATNRNLPEAVRDGDFRRDLFFRLNVLTITVPPLRDRREDVEALARHFLHVSANRQSRSSKEFGEGAIDALLKYDWPGNVRELRSVVERAFSFSVGQTIAPDDIQFSHLDVGAHAGDAYAPVSLAEMEKRHIEATLHFTKWVKREAARILDIERSTLDRKLQAYDIQRPEDES